MRLAFAALALALSSAAPALAVAQDAPAHEPPPEALALYQHGRELYRQGHYREAAQELERALMLDPTSPNLVYNVARVHELLGELPAAISYYDRYLAVLPADDTEERERTQGTIARLRGAQHEVRSPEVRPPSGNDGELRDVGPEVRIEHGVVDEAFIGTAVASGVAIGLAVVMGVLALSRNDALANFLSDGTTDGPGSPMARQSLIDDAHAFSLAADVLGIVGGIGALSAAFLYFLRDRIVQEPRDGAASLRPSVLVDGHLALFALEGTL